MVRYLDDFMNAPVERPRKIAQCAEDARGMVESFRPKFVRVTSDIQILLMQQDVMISDATVSIMETLLQDFSGYLDQMMTAIEAHSGTRNLPQPYDEAKIEQVRERVEKIGYAVVLTEQLAANLVVNRHKALADFCAVNLYERTGLEAVRALESQEVVDILFNAVGEIVDGLGLIALLREVSTKIQKKRARKAGVKPGDTDTLFELEEILLKDVAVLDAISEAVSKTRELLNGIR